MTKQFREAQIRFEKQLDWYIKNLGAQNWNCEAFDLVGMRIKQVKILPLEKRMKRELNRTFELSRPINEGEHLIKFETSRCNYCGLHSETINLECSNCGADI